MSEQVTVEAVKDARDWESPDGTKKNTYYTLDIKRADGTSEEVDHGRRQDSPEPQPGEVLEVVFEDGKFRRKMKKAPQGFSGGSPRPSGGKSKEWQPESERDPERAARILRQHSQGMAVQVLTAMNYFDGIETQEHAIEAEATLKTWTDFFDADVIEAGKQSAKQGTGAQPQQVDAGVTSPPSDSPASQAPSIQEMDEALNTAGLLTPSARDMVTQFMVAQLSEDEIGRAVDRLVNGSDTAEQATTLDKLKKRTVQWSGKPLPQGDSLDGESDIPFRRPEYTELFTERERWRF